MTQVKLKESQDRLAIEWRPLDDVQPYENNPRRNDDAVDAVACSIEQFGFRQPIVVDAAGVIVVGHTRWKAARKLGLVEVGARIGVDVGAEEGGVLEQRLGRHDGGGARLLQALLRVLKAADAPIGNDGNVQSLHHAPHRLPVGRARVLLVLLPRTPVHAQHRRARLLHLEYR